MGKHVTNVAASVRQRLLNLSRTTGGDYNALLTQYAIERFLFRLSKCDLADRFVLKGAMLFRVWASDLHRPDWREFLQRPRIEDAPANLVEVVKIVRERMWPAIGKARGRS